MRFLLVTLLFSLIAPTLQGCCPGAPTPVILFPPMCSGNCNVFCCNCDYCGRPDPCPPSRSDPFGYRLKRRVCNHKRSTIDFESVDVSLLRFNAVDTDGDGLITENEGMAFFLNGTSRDRVKRQVETNWFHKLDVNEDGYIQPGEFDNSLE